MSDMPIRIKRTSLVCITVMTLLLQGCFLFKYDAEETITRKTPKKAIGNSILVPGQVAPPDFIKSLTLVPEYDAQGAPVLVKDSDQRLILEFDDIRDGNRLYTVTLTHHDADWRESRLLPINISDGLLEDQITDGAQSSRGRTPYWHYRYRFPNASVRPRVSGNFMIVVSDQGSGDILFSMPFFISEETGDLSINFEQLFNLQRGYFSNHQIFGRYRYPSTILFPQVDMSFYFTQNRFYGRTRKADVFDINEPGIIGFHNSRPNTFVANYDFYTLNLRSVRVGGNSRFRTVRQDTFPHQIYLFNDIPALNRRTSAGRLDHSPLIETDRDAEYADVHFELDLGSDQIPGSGQIYIYGSWNNWRIDKAQVMSFDRTSRYFKGSARIKQGVYDYKYVLVKDGVINDIQFDPNVSPTEQEYITWIYFKDPNDIYDRLLLHLPAYSR